MDLKHIVVPVIFCFALTLCRNANRGKERAWWNSSNENETIPWLPEASTETNDDFGQDQQDVGSHDAIPACVCMPVLDCGASWRQGGGEPTDQEEFQCPNSGDVCCESSSEVSDKPIEPIEPTEPIEPIEPHETTPSWNPAPPEVSESSEHVEPVCGVSKNTNGLHNNKIPEVTASFGEYSWTILLSSDDNGFDSYRCGASLIQPNIAITAGHCVFNFTNRPESLVARAGEWDLTQENEPLPHQDRTVSSIIIHPQFDGRNPANNIAILTFNQPFDLAENVNTICLLGMDEEMDMQHCVATGWGKDIYGQHQQIMKSLVLPEVSTEMCQMQLRKTRLGRFFKLHPTMMCAGGSQGIDTCVGDGGGPLACLGLTTNTYHLVGITSWGMGCGRQGIPGVYTDVRKFSDWIENQVKDIRLDKSLFTWKQGVNSGRGRKV